MQVNSINTNQRLNYSKNNTLKNSTVPANRNKTSFNGKVYMPKPVDIKRELVFFGPPGCGKGTQTGRLADTFGLARIDTGSLLRSEISEGTDVEKLAKSFIEKGVFVPFEVIAKMIKGKLAQPECKNGYILDGFPRNVEQAKFLDSVNKELDAGKDSSFKAIYFEVDQEKLLDRIVNRQSCPQCNTIYNKKFKPSKVADECDTCHVPLKTRADDTEEIARSRFETYNQQTAPLVEYYENKGVMHKVDAEGSIEDVWNRILDTVRK